jgi:hypothetical protein
MDPLLWPARRVFNALGLAWWARIETRSPDATYWFGPFVRREQLDESLPAFLEDVRSEGPAQVQHTIVQTRRGEPLTEAADLTIETGNGAG